MTTRIAVVGASGRLGTQVCDVIAALPGADVIATLDSRSDLHDMLGADLAIDVTLPSVSSRVVDFALAQGIRVLVGTSGWSGERVAQLTKTVESMPGASVFIVPNFSLGATLQGAVARILAEHFESIEIVETHHAGKVDSPSGTAVRVAEQISDVRRERGGVIAPHSNQTARGELVAGVPIHSLRLSGVIAHQDIVFGGVGESLTISHDTHSRDAYSAGIALAITYAMEHTGVAVGLEHALGLATP
jgi:4-hydroxy-tetrahydrodipicolinate reductase